LHTEQETSRGLLAFNGEDWRVSPLRVKSLAGIAPPVVCTAWFDPLRDEGDAYADARQAAGFSTKRHQDGGLIHGYFARRSQAGIHANNGRL
jgi:acetyl esterase